MKDRIVICTSCPLGCRIKVSVENGKISISGNERYRWFPSKLPL